MLLQSFLSFSSAHSLFSSSVLCLVSRNSCAPRLSPLWLHLPRLRIKYTRIHRCTRAPCFESSRVKTFESKTIVCFFHHHLLLRGVLPISSVFFSFSLSLCALFARTENVCVIYLCRILSVCVAVRGTYTKCFYSFSADVNGLKSKNPTLKSTR